MGKKVPIAHELIVNYLTVHQCDDIVVFNIFEVVNSLILNRAFIFATCSHQIHHPLEE